MSKLFKKLCQEVGLIYKHKTKSWISQASHDKPMTAGVIYTSVDCEIGDKEDGNAFHLFDGHHEETPWQYFDRISCLKDLRRNGMLQKAFLKVNWRKDVDYSLRIRFCKCSYTDDDFVEFYMVLGKHKTMPNVKENITNTEVKRAATIARQVLKDAGIKVKTIS